MKRDCCGHSHAGTSTPSTGATTTAGGECLPQGPRKVFLDNRRVFSVFMLRLFMTCSLQQAADVSDEWWQSTEVAYKHVFPNDSVRLPWEWEDRTIREEGPIRTYMYPMLFDFLFRCLELFGIDTPLTVWIAPKVLCAAIATAIDIQTYYLGEKVDMALGLLRSSEANHARGGLTVAKMAFFFSMFHWFTGMLGPRTQSNIVETLVVLTAFLQSNFILFLFYGGFGCALRLTSVVPLLPIGALHILSSFQHQHVRGLAKCGIELMIIVVVWLVMLAAVDYYYYERWTVTPLNFIVFNVWNGHSALFGTHPWHWYISTALPSVFLPYTVILPLVLTKSFWRSIVATAARQTVVLLCSTVAFTVAVYSFIPHKELRFVFPIMPFLIVIAACVFLHHPLLRERKTSNETLSTALNAAKNGPRPEPQPLRWVFILFLVANIGTYIVSNMAFRRGPVDVASELRTSTELPVIAQMDVLSGCYSIPGHSYYHTRVQKIRMLDCTPSIYRNASWCEQDLFFEDPASFVGWVYDGETNIEKREYFDRLAEAVPRKGSWRPYPDMIVAFSGVIAAINETFLQKHHYTRHKSFFHTFGFPQTHEDYSMEMWKRV